MLISYKRSQTSIILRLKIRNSSTGQGLTGLAHNSTGLVISTIADNEATATAYTAAGSTIETITTLGTYAAPTATKCRFKEIDSTNHPGLYELQLADARYAVASAKSLIVSISGATNAANCDALVPLSDIDLYDAVNLGSSAVAAIKAKTDNLPTDPADASDIAASFSSIASTLATIASFIDTEVATLITSVGSSLNTKVTAIQKLLEADLAVDTSVTPWALVFLENGTGGIGVGMELLRQPLKDVNGNTVTSTSTIIGRAGL